MTTTSKDFKVKHGIQVTGDATVGGTITAATPTADNHVVTLGYFNANGSANFDVASTAPSNPINGQTFFDSVTSRLNVYMNGSWITMAAVDDTLAIAQHIHDTSIDGNGLIVTSFINGGSLSDPQSSPVDAGVAATSSWDVLYDGGTVIDTFN
jgi:hypothetical protein